MIASLRGTVLDVGLTSAVIEVGGVGMAFQATAATLAGLRVGQEGYVLTELVVREDSLTLYGFAQADERDCFRVLMTAKGVGAKLALSILSVLTPDALRRAIAAEDVAALKRVPGLGPKGAQRIIIDVGTRLGPPTGPVAPGATVSEAASAPAAAANSDVVAALVQLGWNEASAQQAVVAVEAEQDASGEAGAASQLSTPELLRASLRWLGSARRG